MRTAAFTALCVGAFLFPAAAQSPAQSGDPVFGTTVVIPSGLRGEIYFLPPRTSKLPGFSKLDPVGTVYTSKLNIPVHRFFKGFPGVTDRFEWFAIDYTGRFWIEQPGDYTFALTSDDGSRLYIDGHLTIDNDGIHVPVRREAVVSLAGGIHNIRVSYFQGPRFDLALQLEVRPRDGKFRIFDTDDFKPPHNPDDWKYSKGDELNGDSSSSAVSHSAAAQKAFDAGAAALADDKPGDAAHDLESATRLDPAFAPAWSMLGVVRYRNGWRDEARVAWRKALSADPADIKAAVHLASLDLEQHRDEDALQVTKAAIASGHPDNPVLYYCNAVANANLRNVDAAIDSARKATELDMAGETPRAAKLLEKLQAKEEKK